MKKLNKKLNGNNLRINVIYNCICDCMGAWYGSYDTYVIQYNEKNDPDLPV